MRYLGAKPTNEGDLPAEEYPYFKCVETLVMMLAAEILCLLVVTVGRAVET
jgi:hypothetical protein